MLAYNPCRSDGQLKLTAKRQTDNQTGESNGQRYQESNLLHFKMWHIYGGNTFNDLPDNQLTKFRVFIGWSRIFLPPPFKFLWKIAPRPPLDGRPWWTQRENRQRQTDNWTNGRVSVSLSPRWSLTLIDLSQYAGSQSQGTLLRRTRRFFTSGARKHRQYSLNRPTEGRPGWVGLKNTGMVDPPNGGHQSQC